MNYLLSWDRWKNDFDEGERIPLILSECGHTFWSVCIREILNEEEEKIWPECTSPLRETDEAQFRQNIKILRFMKERAERDLGLDEMEDTIECSKHLRKPVEYFCK